ncbi:hypothetical protein AOT96_22285 [Rhodococcus sp. 008]|nr:hypothetical protein AOT96_22285 [Rhodococcus sp. 008]
MPLRVVSTSVSTPLKGASPQDRCAEAEELDYLGGRLAVSFCTDNAVAGPAHKSDARWSRSCEYCGETLRVVTRELDILATLPDWDMTASVVAIGGHHSAFIAIATTSPSPPCPPIASRPAVGSGNIFRSWND